jgi:transcription elongation factor Elf1
MQLFLIEYWHGKNMKKVYSVKETDYKRIINDFKSTRFSCIKCGSKNLEIINADSHLEGIKDHGGSPNSPNKDIGLTLYVAGILSCRKCNHRFHVKISDQGIRNTNLYFDNSLS